MALSVNGLADQVRLCNNAPRLRRAAFLVIDRLQMTQVNGGEQIVGAAIALVSMCQTAGVALDDVITKARNAIADADRHGEQLAAVRDYARNELREEVIA
jgi:hypothetical protein